jgi:hypothetical protein
MVEGEGPLLVACGFGFASRAGRSALGRLWFSLDFGLAGLAAIRYRRNESAAAPSGVIGGALMVRRTLNSGQIDNRF